MSLAQRRRLPLDGNRLARPDQPRAGGPHRQPGRRAPSRHRARDLLPASVQPGRRRPSPASLRSPHPLAGTPGGGAIPMRGSSGVRADPSPASRPVSTAPGRLNSPPVFTLQSDRDQALQPKNSEDHLRVVLLQQERLSHHVADFVQIPGWQLSAALDLAGLKPLLEAWDVQSFQDPALDAAFPAEETGGPVRNHDGLPPVRWAAHPVCLGRDQEAESTRAGFGADHQEELALRSMTPGTVAVDEENRTWGEIQLLTWRHGTGR